MTITDTTNLNGAYSVTVSPCGKNVYAVSHSSSVGTIVYWDRNMDTGELTNQVNLIDSTNLEYPINIVISPDGKNAYVADYVADGRLVYYTRDTETGALTYQDSIVDATNLLSMREAVVSPDGKFVYAVAYNADSIVYWNRNTDTGVSALFDPHFRWCLFVFFVKKYRPLMLTVILCFLLFFPLLFVFFLFDHHQPPHHPQALTNQVNLIDSSNLNGVWELDMSPDGKNVYAVTISSDAIVYWDRDTDTGVSAPLITYSLRTFFLFC